MLGRSPETFTRFSPRQGFPPVLLGLGIAGYMMYHQLVRIGLPLAAYWIKRVCGSDVREINPSRSDFRNFDV